MASGGKKKVGFFCFHALSFTLVEFLENIRKKKKESFFFPVRALVFPSFQSRPPTRIFFFFVIVVQFFSNYNSSTDVVYFSTKFSPGRLSTSILLAP